MEAAMNLLSSAAPFPSMALLRNSSSSFSVSLLHEQASTAVTSMVNAPASRHFPTSVLSLEQRDEFRSFFLAGREDTTTLSTMDRKQMESEASIQKEYKDDQLLEDLENQLLHWPDLSYILRSLRFEENAPLDTVSLAKEALRASQEVVLLTKNSKLSGTEIDECLDARSKGTSSEEVKRVRSTRIVERRSKKRRVSKPRRSLETSSSKTSTKSESYDPNDPLRLFLWGPETTQLLTIQEESQLMCDIQDLKKLLETKRRLEAQFGREPTLVEWAGALGTSCGALQSQLHYGKRSRERLIYANFRMVVHIAKQYQGRGLCFQDLLQEGSMGLMKSVEKFKPQAGCRFPSYAYWWIRQTIRKAIFQHSRTIRLPENMYTLLGKVAEAKKSYMKGGYEKPTNEQLAQRVGISVDKLQNLLSVSRLPLSLQQPVWSDQDTTFQEVTPDMAIESPDISFQKQIMRRHIRNLLGTLDSKERQVIRLRYGIGSGNRNSLSEIGVIFGLSKERVRQIENGALYKLKQSLNSHGLNAYASLLA